MVALQKSAPPEPGLLKRDRIVQEFPKNGPQMFHLVIRVWPVTSSNVVIELEEHRQDVTAELDSSIRGMSSSIARMIEVARVLFPERAFAPFEFAPNGFQDPVSMVLDRLVDATAVCQHTDACTLKAANRVRSGLPPSKPGKQEFKDCEIFECFLELSAELRASGFEPAIVFVSPNKNDYGPPPDGFAAIANEIRSVNASYVANLSWARALLAGY